MESNLRTCSRSRVRACFWRRWPWLRVTCRRGEHREWIRCWRCDMNDWPGELWRRLRSLIHRRQFERDLDEEMRLHKGLRQQDRVGIPLRSLAPCGECLLRRIELK